MSSRQNDILRTRLEEVNTAISEQQALLDKITKTMVELQADRRLIQSQLDSIVYPVHSLPLDVILEIFGHCVSESGPRTHGGVPVVNWEHNFGHESYWSPTTIFRVCRSWREIALATPTLWTTIDFRPRHDCPGHRVERYLEYRAIITRDLPLSVNINSDEIVRNLGRAAFATLIRRAAPRLASLKLRVAAKGIFELDRYPPSFPLLQKLEIHFGDEDCMGSRDIERAFKHAPLLRDVRTRSGPIDFPWTQLKRFDGLFVEDEECWHILTLATNLVEATFNPHTYEAPPDDLVPLRHSKVQTFTLIGSRWRPKGYTSVLPLLTLPALQNLHLLEHTENDIDHILLFLPRHAAQLRTFRFSGRTELALTLKSLHPMLHLTDLTLELGIEPMPYIHEFIHELEDLEKAFLPQLRRISLLRCGYLMNSTDIEMVARGLSTRWETPNNQLASFRLELSLPYRSTDGTVAPEFPKIRPSLDLLTALARKGMHIYVGTRDTNYVWCNEMAVVVDLSNMQGKRPIRRDWA
ncbi:hypothetical protein B0H16DRAFT_1890933 [Mycena metata]|uniref:F-box domain-containing protein n=1 Tax=Mycena metata TaxID=1033252 RepID=A0AAD7IC70_9AGAR|nr:hypothetical protein B0H16DRAFT_1890933 [Mycena metata]